MDIAERLQAHLDAKVAARTAPAEAPAAEAEAPAAETEETTAAAVETEGAEQETTEPEAATEADTRDVLDLVFDDGVTLSPDQIRSATTALRAMRREARRAQRRIEARTADLETREKTMADLEELLRTDTAGFLEQRGFDLRKWAIDEVERETATPEQRKIAELEAKLAAVEKAATPPDPAKAREQAQASDRAVLERALEESPDEYPQLADYDPSEVAVAAVNELYSVYESTGRVLTASEALGRVARRVAFEAELNDAKPRDAQPAREPVGAVKQKPITTTNRATAPRTAPANANMTPAERRANALRVMRELRS